MDRKIYRKWTRIEQNQCKKGDTDRESIQSTTKPDPGYHMGKWQKHKQEPRGQPFPAGDHKAAMNRRESMTNTRHEQH